MRIKNRTYTLINNLSIFIHKVINNLVRLVSTLILSERQSYLNNFINLSSVPTTSTTS